ncbi:methyltransferase domain-containing protein [Paenibacillus phocaensis]|uniref:methyltransferase domain-containing protein n=1 Tax=Paenibacillus phocaensis TaxID=1776378 RepID=UPI000839C1FB|nr:methyltransferase domain-containing protein [Paenibacillus phocaensis]
MRIDLGSGKQKFPNCIGIDRVAYLDTDLVHDFNRPLPFEDNSVEFVMASHSLQFADDLPSVLKELYRICRHKAMVCIVAPYAHASSHMINPQFKQWFNEHSPRYWTNSSETVIDKDEYLLSQNNSWSLLEDDPLPFDFRVLRMEFFYFPAYQSGYDPFELALLRQTQFNVAYQIMYHLLVVKQPVSMGEMLFLSRNEEFEEPDYVKEQRLVSPTNEATDRPLYLDHMEPVIQYRDAGSPQPQPPAIRHAQPKIRTPKNIRQRKRNKKQVPSPRRG